MNRWIWGGIGFGLAWGVFSCGQKQIPQGGPKDSLAPMVVKVVPAQGSKNFQGKRLVWTFDENIQVQRLQERVLISPFIAKKDYKFKIIGRKRLRLTFKTALAPHTTYRINLSGVVSDINEGNVKEVLGLSFSTGPFIDSLQVEGNITHSLTGKAGGNILVVLIAEDSLTLGDITPLYLARSGKDGHYRIDYLPEGEYFILAFEDGNKNGQMEVEKERYGRHEEKIVLKENLENKNIQVHWADIRPLKLVQNRIKGNYNEIVYNKGIYEIYIVPQDTLYTHWQPHFLSNHKTLQWIGNETIAADSLLFILTATDSLKITQKDSVWVQNRKGIGRKDPLTITWKVSKGYENEREKGKMRIETLFNKPMKPHIQKDSLYIQLDSVKIFLSHIEGVRVDWDKGKKRCTWSIPMDKDKEGWLVSAETAFIDTEEQYSPQDSLFCHTIIAENYGEVNGRCLEWKKGEEALLFPPQSYQIELLSPEYEVLQHQQGQEFVFSFLYPGNYKLRVWIDEDNNGIWFAGNILTQEKSERIWILEETIQVRANWVLENILLKPSDPL